MHNEIRPLTVCGYLARFCQAQLSDASSTVGLAELIRASGEPVHRHAFLSQARLAGLGLSSRARRSVLHRHVADAIRPREPSVEHNSSGLTSPGRSDSNARRSRRGVGDVHAADRRQHAPSFPTGRSIPTATSAANRSSSEPAHGRNNHARRRDASDSVPTRIRRHCLRTRISPESPARPSQDRPRFHPARAAGASRCVRAAPRIASGHTRVIAAGP